MAAYMLTTIDNPFDPRTDWDEWKRFDEEQGHNTCAYLARIAYTAEELSDEENEKAINQAIDEIIQLNIEGIYTKVEIEG